MMMMSQIAAYTNLFALNSVDYSALFRQMATAVNFVTSRVLEFSRLGQHYRWKLREWRCWHVKAKFHYAIWSQTDPKLVAADLLARAS